jgi:hypothetical protein
MIVGRLVPAAMHGGHSHPSVFYGVTPNLLRSQFRSSG